MLSIGNQYKDNDETTIALLQDWSFITLNILAVRLSWTDMHLGDSFTLICFFSVNQNKLIP